MNDYKDKLGTLALFCVIAILTFTTIVYARNAETEAKKVSRQLDSLTLTAQNRCIIKVILSYPPPISQAQFDVVLADYDKCIQDEINKAK